MPGRALHTVPDPAGGTAPSRLQAVREVYRHLRRQAPYCISKALIAARNGDWENDFCFLWGQPGEVNTLSTVPQQMAQIMEEWRSAQ